MSISVVELSAIVAAVISLLGILWRVSDLYRKNENKLDSRFNELGSKIDILEGKVATLLAFRKFPQNDYLEDL